MSGVFVFREITDAIGALRRQSVQAVRDFVLGTETDALTNRDPIMEVVEQNPQEALWFIKLVMAFGASTGLLVSAPCIIYLALYWKDCLCDPALLWWVSVFSWLQMTQVPVRYIFFYHLRHVPRENLRIIQTIRRMTGGCGWRCSKVLSVVSYGWFILGVVWVFNAKYCKSAPGLWRITTSVIIVSIFRLAATFVCFWVLFPPSVHVLMNRDGDRNGWNRIRGATKEEIASLPLIKFNELKSLDTSEHYGDLRKRHIENSIAEQTPICCICLSEFSGPEIIRILPCTHIFHHLCIDKWLIRNRQCPLCQRHTFESGN